MFEEIESRLRTACGDAHLKVILETGELSTYANVRRASWLAMLAGADFIKTSTGKVGAAGDRPPVTPGHAGGGARDFRRARRAVQVEGCKAAGGIRPRGRGRSTWCWSTRPSGAEWLTTPSGSGFGASSRSSTTC